MDKFRYFRYRTINKNLIDSLVNGYLYFSLPEKLNDPFDCQVDLKKSANYAASKVSGLKKEILLKIADLDGFTGDIQSRLKKIGVCSFSLELDNPLLWSHYADEHRGICLMYEFTEDFFLDKENSVIGVSDIQYGKNPLSDWLIENIPDKVEDDFCDKFTKELLKRVLIVKSVDWRYENECRIIREEPGQLTYCKSFLTQICFGMRTPEPDIQLIKRLVSASGYNPNFCRINKAETDFGIKATEI